MRTITIVALLSLLPISTVIAASETPDPRLGPEPAVAAASKPGPLAAAATRAVSRLAEGSLGPAQATSQPDASTPRSWRARHPALTGAFIGAGVGAPVALAIPEFACGGGDENCLYGTGTGALIGAGIGAGVGSLVGWLGSLARR